MTWGSDGELTAQDLSLVMERLAQVDQEVAALQQPFGSNFDDL